MNANFEGALEAVFAVEGGYADHPLDPGGPTRFGVTQATLAMARGRPVSAEEVGALGRDEAAAIYRRFYWEAVRADALPAGLDLVVFDIAVNSGPRRAALLLQGALGLAPDGEIGPATLAAAAAAPPAELIAAIGRDRMAFLRRLAGWATFGTGWTRRVRTIEGAALALAGAVSTAPKGPQPEKDAIFMDSIKPIMQSRTVWSNAIGLIAVAASMFGFDASGIDPGQVADTVLQVVAGLSFIASTAFRIAATRRLT